MRTRRGFRQAAKRTLRSRGKKLRTKRKTAPRPAANVGVRASQLSSSFVIESWAACAPGVDTPQRWSQWAAAPWLPEGVPPRSRSAGRWPRCCAMALLAARPPGRAGRHRWALGVARRRATPPASHVNLHDNPTVYASRYGETGRCLDLLAEQARGNAMSPTNFGLSVHNAIGAMVALSARRSAQLVGHRRRPGVPAAAGVAEGRGASGRRRKLRQPRRLRLAAARGLPPAFEDEPSAHFAWAWLPAAAAGRRAGAASRTGRPRGRSTQTMPGEPRASARRPAGPVVRPVPARRSWRSQIDGRRCRWSRDA